MGVQVLSSSTPPNNYHIASLHGLVDELLVEDDPENDWQDNFRTCRVSNDARQLLFYMMDGKLRRQMGRKVADCGGNALLGYQTHFDLEKDFIIARGIGTAVTLQQGSGGGKAAGLGSLSMQQGQGGGSSNSSDTPSADEEGGAAGGEAAPSTVERANSFNSPRRSAQRAAVTPHSLQLSDASALVTPISPNQPGSHLADGTEGIVLQEKEIEPLTQVLVAPSDV